MKQKFIDKDTRPLYILSAFIIALAIGMGGWMLLQRSSDTTEIVDGEKLEQQKNESDNCSYRRALDGVCVSSSAEQYPKLVAVMIENHPDARPQSGLADASIVYEAPVEANYSRFMAVFPATAEVEKVGPVRSARPYYVSWAQEYAEPMYMHVGGSPDALEKIDNDGVFDMNEFYRGWYFWRSKDRFAPHNTYTSNQLWGKAWNDYGKEKKSDGYASWTYDDAPLVACTEDCASIITATFLAPSYQAVWKHNTSTNQYERYQGGKPHIDQNGKPIIADTVIVQRVETTVLDAVGRIMMDTLANGKAIVFRDGHAVQGTWTKETKKGRTKWVNNEGKEIPLRSGKIWIEVVNQVGNATYK